MFWLWLWSVTLAGLVAVFFLRRPSRKGTAAGMDQLPNELVSYIVSYLDVEDLLRLQSTSRRLREIAGDPKLWREKCFERRPGQKSPPSKGNDANSSQFQSLRDTVSTLAGASSLGMSSMNGLHQSRIRALANWDPSYQDEHVDFFQEYVHRYAPFAPVEWCSLPRDGGIKSGATLEATGLGTLPDSDGMAHKMIAPMNNGSICIWDLQHTGSITSVQLAGQSHRGLLAGVPGEARFRSSLAALNSTMTDVEAADCVSIDPVRNIGYFAVQSRLLEVDLTTLSLVSQQPFPFPITALSPYHPSHPLTIGTTNTLHLHDPRLHSSSTHSTILIAGPPTHVSLPQPSPLSLLPTNNSVHVAGNFTHILTYDLRHARLLQSRFSGARLSALSTLPSNPPTLIAAGVYKGKGSLELHHATSAPFLNRQTAARTRLLSLQPHGASIVTTDADGGIAWFERDARHRIRSFNINDIPEDEGAAPPPSFNTLQSRAQERDDFVRRTVPLRNGGRGDALLLWTGEGRLGVLGWGHRATVGFAADEEQEEEWVEGAERARRRAQHDAERKYAGSMRRALEGQASEMRWMRGLGL